MDNKLRFRAWLPELKKMMHPIAIRYVSKGIAIEYEDNGERCVDGPGWFEIMQCTGLIAAKSYRGTRPEDLLVFEGDICRDNAGTVVKVIWTDKYQFGCVVVKGATLTVGLTFPLWQWNKCKDNGYRELEIIGTIHDRPGLLEG